MTTTNPSHHAHKIMTTATTTATTASATATMEEITLKCADGLQMAAQCWTSTRRDVEEVKSNSNNGINGAVVAPHYITTTSTNNNNPVESRLQDPSAVVLKSQSPHHRRRRRRALLLHGWLDNCQSFAHLAPTLCQSWPAGSQVVAVDLPGHGWSDHKHVTGPPLLMAEGAYYVAEALQQLRWIPQESKSTTTTSTKGTVKSDDLPLQHDDDKVVLIGHSMGAAIASIYAAAFGKEQLSHLILLDGLAPMAKPASDVAHHVRAHIERRQAATRADPTLLQPRTYPTLEHAVRVRCQTPQTWPGKQWITRDAARIILERGMRPVSPDQDLYDQSVQFRHDLRLLWPSLMVFTPEQTEAIYRDISCPTAILLAEHGFPRDPVMMERMRHLLQPRQVKTLPGSHHFHIDPETAPVVATAVVDFLKE